MPQLSVPLLLGVIVGGTIGLIIALAATGRPVRGVWIVAGMVLAAALGIQVNWLGRLVVTFWTPIQLYRSHLFLSGGALLFIVVIGLFAHRALQRLAAPTVVLLVIAGLAGLLRLVHGDPKDGVATLGFAVATLMPLGYFGTSFASEWTDWHKLFRALTVANVIWILGVFVQLVVNPSVLTVSNSSRFVGLTGNPQHCAVYLSIMCVLLLWLAMNDPQRRYLGFWIALLGIDGVLLMWTGSRTGLLMVLTGSTLLLWRRIGQAILLLPIAAAVAFAAIEFVPGLDIGSASSRLTSVENTRASVWLTLLKEGMANPIIGAGVDATKSQDASENSYLLAWAAYGFGMVIVLIGLMIVSAAQAFRLLRARSWLGEHAPLADLVCAYYPMFFLGALFEGYIMARVSVTLVFLVLYSSLGVALLRALAAEQEYEPAPSARGDSVDLDPATGPAPGGYG